MSDGIKSARIIVRLPDALVRRARGAVRSGRAASVSSYVAAALEERVKLEDLAKLLDEMLAETGGRLTAAERRAADGDLNGAPRRKRRS